MIAQHLKSKIHLVPFGSDGIFRWLLGTLKTLPSMKVLMEKVRGIFLYLLTRELALFSKVEILECLDISKFVGFILERKATVKVAASFFPSSLMGKS